jgi:hypothetical protein
LCEGEDDCDHVEDYLQNVHTI